MYALILLVMKKTLWGLFKTYGEVLDVVAHNNLRMRGQAFVSFPDAETAKRALREVQRFPLYSKPMVRASIPTESYLNPCSKYRLRRPDQTQL